MNKFIHDVTYWEPSGVDLYGQPSWSAPVVIKARWERASRFFVNEAGQTESSRSVVMVPSPIEVGAYIFKGISASATPVEGAEEVKSIEEIENVFGDEVDITVMT